MRTMAVVSLLVGACAVQIASAERAPGLLVRFYELDQAVPAVPELQPNQLPNVARVIKAVDLGAPGESCAPMTDNFLTEIDGFINIEHAGEYVFRLTSDDGAVLFIDDTRVVDNDGLHAAVPKDGTINLTAGEHALRIRHFDAGADERVLLEWALPDKGQEFTIAPASVFTHDSTLSRKTAPGKKRIIPPLRRGLPGDGTPVAGPHPGYPPATGDEFPSLVVHPANNLLLEQGFLRWAKFADDAHPRSAVIWIPDADATVPSDALLSIVAGQYRLEYLVPMATEWKRVDLGRAHRQGCVFRFGVYSDKSLLDTQAKAFEMLAVRAMPNGFEIEFTKPLDPRCGWEADNYYVEQWPFDMAQGTAPHRDATVYPVKSASVSPDRTKVFLEIPDLKESHVIYLRLLPPCISADGEKPWSTEAWYTLNKIPTGRAGAVLTPPTPEPENVLTDEEKAAGWELLFDGQTTNGWRGYRETPFPAGWQVRDGCLVRVAPAGDIVTDESFENFELKIDWRISAAGNSGIFYRVDESVGAPWETGPEMQVLDNAEHADGRNPKTSAGANYALYAPVRDVTQPVGFFNHVHIIVNGPHVEHWLNGVKVVEYELGSPDWKARVADSKFSQWPKYGLMKSGHIDLQDHGDKVWFRNIKIRRLPAGK